MKRVALHTLGCKVNQVESEHIKEDFLRRGYEVVDFNQPADVYIVNSCTVTHVSDRKSRAMLRRAARNNPEALVVAAGCAAQRDSEQLVNIDGVGLVVGNRDKENLVAIVEDFIAQSAEEPRIVVNDIKTKDKLKPVIYSRLHQRSRAFVKIQDGCQNFCSYCIVPYVRGPVRSKLPEDLIKEISQLVYLGYQEIVLTGIHTGSYGSDLPGWNLTRLLSELLNKVPGDYRIRLGSLEPLDINPSLLELVQGNKRICRHFHIPLQSGSNRILESMQRRYSREYYRHLLRDISQRIPEAAFAADVMVGYPGEEEKDFQDTLNLVTELPLFDLHVFKFSPRPGTRAATLFPRVEQNVQQRRSKLLLDLAAQKKKEFINRFIGQHLCILVEQEIEKGKYEGLSDNYIQVVFSSSENRTGELVEILIKESRASYAIGEL